MVQAPYQKPGVIQTSALRQDVVGQLARGISHVLCPPCVAIGGILVAAASQPTRQGWLCAGLYVLMAVGGPVLVLLWLLRQGRVSDLDVTIRYERHVPFTVALGGAAAAWGLLYVIEAPPLLCRFAAAHTAVIAIALVVTMSWKISLHAAGVAGVVTMMITLFGDQALAFTLFVCVAWSRLYLGRHTLLQVLAGGLLGSLVFALLLSTP